MIIVKQNKEDIVNFSRVAEIKIIDYEAQKEVLEDKLGDIFASILKANVGIDNTKLSGYAIYAYFEKDNFTILGKYKTMKRAKEVLQDISLRYEAIELCKREHSMSNILGYTFADYTPIYEMPEE
jgi:hypothetical protein|nr:MAG TPA: hypothetical protein [Caudoviricetes sp.]DAE88574.1 MAG TPA: hypothetical protein [Caudoviricetes sp.]